MTDDQIRSASDMHLSHLRQSTPRFSDKSGNMFNLFVAICFCLVGVSLSLSLMGATQAHTKWNILDPIIQSEKEK